MPEKIDNYRILENIGGGGMGTIYKAVQEPLDRVVALKVLSPDMSRNEEFSQRFSIEAKAISRLEHTNIINIYDYGEEGALKFFTMQFVQGLDLGKKISEEFKIPLREILDFSRQICRGLRYAHEKGVIHRDIKPQNIIVDEKGSCVITDFGIARMFEKSNVTMTGTAVGTPEYMSPEQAEGGTLDQQTDIYSLGVVIYEMLTGRPPFTGNNAVAIAYKQVHELPVPPSAFRKDTPKRLELIIMKALKKNRNERYRDVTAMLNDIDTVDIDEKAESPTKPFLRKKMKIKKAPGVESFPNERRITDRRNGDRRDLNRSNDSAFSMTSWSYWQHLIRDQGLALGVSLITLILLLLHILMTT